MAGDGQAALGAIAGSHQSGKAFDLVLMDLQMPGKVGIPDRILLKAGKLTADEFEIMKTHAKLGWLAITNAEKSLGVQADFLTVADVYDALICCCGALS